MPNLIVYVRGLAALPGKGLAWQCVGRTSDMTNEDPDIIFDSDPVDPADDAGKMNQAILNGGIAAMSEKGRVVGVLDTKIVVGAPSLVTASTGL